MTDLLPCPFCGVAPFERFEENRNGPKYPDHWVVWCENLDCRAGGEAMEETQEAARAAWNTRVPAPSVAQAPTRPPSLHSELIQLEAIVHDARCSNEVIGMRIRNTWDIYRHAINSTLSSTNREAPSDGAVYAEVSRRSITPEEDALLMKALRDGAELVEELPSTDRAFSLQDCKDAAETSEGCGTPLSSTDKPGAA